MRLLPDCHSRVPIPEKAEHFRCAHPQVHYQNHEVSAEVCRLCEYWKQPAPDNRRQFPDQAFPGMRTQANVLRAHQTLPRPWESHRVTVAIPFLDTPELLELSVRSWWWQEFRPFLLLIDTGSTSTAVDQLRWKLQQTPSVELASLGIRSAVEHLSDRVSIAMDYAFTRCPTEYLLATHIDVFPRHQQVISRLLELCTATQPVVGWEMSFRGIDDTENWKDFSAGYPGHACTMFHMPTMDRIGAGWSMRRAHHAFGLPRQKTEINGWPDTEVCLGKILQQHGLAPLFLGRETNDENQETSEWVHARSCTVHAHGDSGLLARHHSAMRDAIDRVQTWESQATSTRDGTPPEYFATLGPQSLPEVLSARLRR